MKKITILSLHLGYGGIEKCVTSLANKLSIKYDVNIVCSYKVLEKEAFAVNENVKITYLLDYGPNKDEIRKCLSEKKFLKLFKELFKGAKTLFLRKHLMVKYIKNSDASVMIATRDIFDKWVGKYAKTGVLKIGWEHNHYHDNIKYASKITKCAKNLDYFVLVSKSLCEFYSDKIDNCVYIPNFIDYVPTEVSNLENKNIISVGRLSKEKGFEDLVKVFNLFSLKQKQWHLDIVGDGDCFDDVNNLIKENTTMHGFQSKEYINKLLSQSSIYAMCSYTESFGIVLIEAMSFGIPCIAFSSAEGACDIISDGVNGFLIDNRDFNQMAEKINLLASDYELRKKMGINARKTALKYHSDFVINDWIKLIEKSD